MSENTPVGVLAGWYIDPNDSRLQRWWSSSEWTEHVCDADADRHPAEAVTRAPAAVRTATGSRHVRAEMTLSISSFVGGRYPRHRVEVAAVA